MGDPTRCKSWFKGQTRSGRGGTTRVRRDGQAHLRWWPSLRPPWAGTLGPLSISTTYGSSTSTETLKGADPCPARPGGLVQTAPSGRTAGGSSACFEVISPFSASPLGHLSLLSLQATSLSLRGQCAPVGRDCLPDCLAHRPGCNGDNDNVKGGRPCPVPTSCGLRGGAAIEQMRGPRLESSAASLCSGYQAGGPGVGSTLGGPSAPASERRNEGPVLGGGRRDQHTPRPLVRGSRQAWGPGASQKLPRPLSVEWARLELLHWGTPVPS